VAFELARRLGISRKALWERRLRFGLSRSRGRSFTGGSAAETLAAVLTTEPDLTKLPRATPRQICDPFRCLGRVQTGRVITMVEPWHVAFDLARLQVPSLASLQQALDVLAISTLGIDLVSENGYATFGSDGILRVAPAAALKPPLAKGQEQARFWNLKNAFRDAVDATGLVRNCLVHRMGMVSPLDVEADGTLKLTYRALELYSPKPDGSGETIIDRPGVPGEPGAPIMMRAVDRTRVFQLGERNLPPPTFKNDRTGR
jgi:hypothetical protein